MHIIPERFSNNQWNYIERANTSWLNISEGGKRAGKNILTDFIFCTLLETHPNKVHLIAGVTQGTARLNVLDCDGLGVYNYFYGRYRVGKYENKEAVYIKTKTGTKILIIAGGGKKGDEKIIKGNTYGMAYVTEANECHPDFINEVFDRTLSSGNRKIFFDLNPKAPNNWFYKDIEEFHKNKQQLDFNYGFNYGHFTLVDNMSLSDEKIRDILNTYNHESIWYKRDIKGLRIACEGLCFPQLTEQLDKMMFERVNFENTADINDKTQINYNDIAQIRMGVDFGGNKSQHTFVVTAISRNFKRVYALYSEIVLANGVTPIQLAKRFCEVVKMIYSIYKKAIVCFCDSAEQTLINGLKKEAYSQQLPVEIRNALKHEINDRIRLTNMLTAQNRLWFKKDSTKSLQSALSTAVWDEKASQEGKDVRLDNGTSDIDTLDAFEYTLESETKNLINAFR